MTATEPELTVVARSVVDLLGTDRGADVCTLVAGLWATREAEVWRALDQDRDRLLHAGGRLAEKMRTSLCANWERELATLAPEPVRALVPRLRELAAVAVRQEADRSGEQNGRLGEVLFSAADLSTRVAQLGAQITEDYRGEQVTLVGVMKSAVTFTADLARAIDLPLVVDWVSVSSYGKGISSAGEITFRKDVDEPVAGRHVIVVDDVLATGVTLAWLFDHLGARSPASITGCALLRVPGYQTEDVDVRYVGFDAKADWFAGYGIDYLERYRNLPDLHAVHLT